MEQGFLLVMMSIGDGSVLAAMAAPGVSIGLAGYQMARLVTQCGEVLTPALRAELQAALPR